MRQEFEEWEPKMHIDKEVRTLKTFFSNLPFSPQIRFCFHSTTSKKLKFLFFFFNSFKSLKLKAMRSKMTKGTTAMTNNEFMSTRPFREGSSNMILFFLEQGTLRSYVTDHKAMVASWNKFRSIQNLRLRPKRRLKLKSLYLHFWFLLGEEMYTDLSLEVELTTGTKSGLTTWLQQIFSSFLQ